jgi:hypothetical protein
MENYDQISTYLGTAIIFVDLVHPAKFLKYFF